MTDIFLSIVIPAYNEESRLPKTLEQVFRFLQTQPYSFEVLVVENGSTDRTLQVAQEFAASHAGFFAMHEDGRGKGRAVRRGMLHASGAYRFMCDADLSMPIEEINRFLPPVQTDVDVVIGSREAPGAVRFNEPLYRHWGGRFVNWMIRVLALPGLRDTQCGFKCFRAAVAEDLFQRQTMLGFSFDIELLYIARLRGYRIVELPIPWHFSAESKVHVLRDTWQMMLDIQKMRRNARSGLYQKA